MSSPVRPLWRGDYDAFVDAVEQKVVAVLDYMTVRDSATLTRSVSEAASLTLRVGMLPIHAR
jgi:hypothetical protein